jgi:TRAP-type mannitol/chloroaromatic compound transport system substrate-binding protein
MFTRYLPNLLIVLSLAAVVGLAIVKPTGTPQQARFEWTFQTSAYAGDDFFAIEKAWADNVTELSNGEIIIHILPAGAVVQYNETLEAVGAGILDGHIGDPSYFSGKDPAFAMLGNLVGAWSAPEQMLDFITEGGGYDLYNELINPYGLQFIGASATGLESFLSNKPVRGVADLKGLKLRAPEGMVQEVFAAAGSSPVNLPGSEVYTALEKGVIEAADYTVFASNHSQGMHRFARYPVYPGFHSMPMVEVSMNLKLWQTLSESDKDLLKQSVKTLALDMVAELEAKDQAALKEASQDPDIEIVDWSAEERKAFRNIARSQWKSWATRSPMAQKVYTTVTAHLKARGLLAAEE